MADGQVAPLPGTSSRASSGFSSLLEQLAAAPNVRGAARSRVGRGVRIGDRYVIDRELGQGGMGIVYLAHDERLDREIAVKLCFDAGGSSGTRRVSREAKALAALSHPNVLEVFGIGQHQGMLYIAMEYVAGGTARTWARRRGRRWHEVVDFYCDAGKGLAAAHRAGIVHRDFKPENVLVGADGRPRVADFGLARDAERTPPPPVAAESVTDEDTNERLTRPGSIIGTPAFMAPEQLFGLEVDARADQFSFCCALFEGLFGRRPFPAESAAQRVANLSAQQIDWPRDRRGVPRRVARALTRGLKTDPQARWPSMDALLAALRRRPRGVRATAVVLSAVAVATIGGLFARPDECSARGRLDSIWNPDLRNDLQQHFAATTGDGTSLAEQVLPELDTYAFDWSLAYAEACDDAEKSDVEFDARMGCLARLRAGLASRLDLLTQGDETVAVRALALVRGMESPARCTAAGASNAPRDPASERILRQLDRSRAEREAGAGIRADELSTAALARARALGDPHMLARALAERGHVLGASGHQRAERTALEEAYFVAVSNQDDEVQVDVLPRLMVAHAKDGPGGFEAAMRWYALARAAQQRLGSVGSDPIDLRIDHALALKFVERLDASRAEFEAVLAELDRRGDHDGRRRFRALDGLTTVRQYQGDDDGNLERRQRLLDLARIHWGDRHPRVAACLENLAVALSSHSRDEEAGRLLTRSLELYEAALGPRNPKLVEVYNKISGVQRRTGHAAEAVQTLRSALELELELGTGPAMGLVNLRSNLGSALLNLGRKDEAIIELQRAVSVAESSLGPQATRTALAQINLGAALLAVRRYRACAEVSERAARSLSQQAGQQHRGLLVASVNVSLARLALGESEAALESLQRARQVAGQRISDQAELESLHGAILRDSGDYDGASAAFQSCAELLDETPDLPQRIKCLADHGHVELLARRLGVAREILNPLLEQVLQSRDDLSPSTVGNVHYNLARALEKTDRARGIELLESAIGMLDAERSAFERDLLVDVKRLLRDFRSI